MTMIFVNPNSEINRDMPNMSLAYAATHFKARVIDFNTMPEPRDRFLEEKVDKIGISVQSRTLTEAKKLGKEYGKKYPGSKIASVSTDIDIQCCYPFLKFDDDFSLNKVFSDEYPFPDFELFDSFDMFSKNWETGKWNYIIMTSLGCPFQCKYCSARNRKWKPRSARNCYEELKQAKKKWKIKRFEILDDCFNLDKKRVIDFCKLVKKLDLKWFCVNGLRADLFDEEMAKAMAEAGCEYVGFGAETMDPEVLKIIMKNETPEQIEKAVEIAKKYFKSVNVYFIIGLPRSTYEGDLENVRWVARKRVNGHFSYYVPRDQADSLFYGEKSKPTSNAYPKELQTRIYDMTEYMRDIFNSSIGKKMFATFKTVLLYDTKYLPVHFISGVERLRKKIL